jgi:23S rRNA (guanosine2251-2'-O)-methyltransferase
VNGEHNIVYGVNPISEKLRASPAELVEILIAEGSQRPNLRSLAAEAKRRGVRVTYTQTQALDRLAAGQRHQGVIARVTLYAYLEFAQLLQNVSTPAACWILFLDGLTDPHNFGALLRTAEAVGVRHVVIPKDRSVDVTPTVVKASAGAVYHLKIYKVANLRRAIAVLKEHGFWIVGLAEKAAETIYDRVYADRLGIVLGSEGGGIRPIVLRECDYAVSIPMRGQVSSLNVGVAGGVFLYELVRQQRCVDKAGVKR